jgi:hypothetical protein
MYTCTRAADAAALLTNLTIAYLVVPTPEYVLRDAAGTVLCEPVQCHVFLKLCIVKVLFQPVVSSTP